MIFRIYICTCTSSSNPVPRPFRLFNVLCLFLNIENLGAISLLLTVSSPSLLFEVSIVSILPQLQSSPVTILLPFQTTKHHDILIPTLRATLFHGGAAQVSAQWKSSSK